MSAWLARAERSGKYPFIAHLSAANEAIEASLRPADPHGVMAPSFVDGFHTIGSMFASTVFGMIEGDLQPVDYSASPGKFAAGIYSEAARIHAPVAVTARQAVDDFEHDGVFIPRDTSIYMMWLVANRDPEVFEEPLTYKLDRTNGARRFTFGGGPYICAGRNLVRALCEALALELARAGVRVETVGDVRWTSGSVVHELTDLHLKLL
jgi:cytochrome P450